MKKICLLFITVMALCLTACGTAGDSDTSKDTVTDSETNANDKTFELTEDGKAFLARMCRELSDFDSNTEMDDQFWKDFLFFSYTGASPEEAEMTQIYREDLGFEETVVKVSLEEAEAYAKLVFGMELPDIKPAFEDMEEGQTSCYYEDGYYYIGVSDFPDFQYTFASLEEADNYVTVTYTIDFEGESNAGSVNLILSPEDNENGFIIRSKTTEFLE